ncbi:unnamed protein product [Brachionus calyciflorus]|uniref:Cell wall hydrolase SleB domain-containing protein n=1 Tax=Brachionus calyciflorus TaxID=104777 RepID=A0A813WMC5_9BILA|nr:unnamed protein product [Brachionus calyciflorus]
MIVTRSSNELEVFAATIYAEARGEPVMGQIWVAWVIKNRARQNRQYWGGNTIKNVCLHNGQFECWNGINSIDMSEETRARDLAIQIAQQVINANHDETNGCDHYNNPRKEGYPPWTNNCEIINNKN